MTMTLESPVRLVCPSCRGALRFGGADIACGSCGAEFEYRDGFPDLILGGRFDDELDPEQNAYEEQSNTWLAREYLIPQLRRLLSPIRAPRVLSLGCGTGADIDLLTEAGFDVVGVDCGNRTASWPHRRERHRFFLANGKHLPFDSGSFDAVYCGCVFPHVGVEGDSTRLRPDYWQERLAIAREISRVLRRGGHVMASSPNRWFPIDLFHGRTPTQPYPRANPPWSRFLLSAGDYRRLFAEAGCGRARMLPVSRYWGFIRARKSFRGRILAVPLETLFELVSTEAFTPLRASALNPWIVVAATKGEHA